MIDSSATIVASGPSGGTCNATGPYLCSTHTDTVLFLKKGDRFPNCPISKSKKGHTTTWNVMNEAAAKPISTVDNLDSTAV